jgi:hypothetical protein
MRKAIWSWGLLFCGCMGSKLDLGAHDAGMGKPGPTSESCENGQQLPIVGSWTGYVENQKWASGSDVVHVVITNANDTLVCGSISLGDAPPPPPATDPSVAYPPGAFDPTHTPATGWSDTTFLNYAEGFVMPMAQGTVTGSRLQFQTNWASNWDGWCGLQTPLSMTGLDGTGLQYSCLLAGGIDSAGCHSSDGSLVDCGKFMLCESFCECTAQGCHAWHENCDTLNFDMQVASDTATGSVDLGCQDVHNLHLSKDH